MKTKITSASDDKTSHEYHHILISIEKYYYTN